jgi:hypothetical protein
MSKAKWHLQSRLVVCLTQALQHSTMPLPIGKSYTCWAMSAASYASGAAQLGRTRSKEQAWLRAMQLFRGAALRWKKDYGRPEALLAWYGRHLVHTLLGRAHTPPSTWRDSWRILLGKTGVQTSALLSVAQRSVRVGD